MKNIPHRLYLTFDMTAYQSFHDGTMIDYIPTDEDPERSFSQLPKVDL